jgi:hypothetical protein
MERSSSGFFGAVPWVLVLLATAGATSIPSLSFEELTDRSELIVTGRINRAWADWDTGHKYIWTHYELGVSAALKGNPDATVILSEPGGVSGIEGMNIAGSVVYHPGETVLLFLQRMPNGYLRTTGWSQGKYRVDKTGRLQAAALPGGMEVVDTKTRSIRATALRSLDGMQVADLRALVSLRIEALRIQAQRGTR